MVDDDKARKAAEAKKRKKQRKKERQCAAPARTLSLCLEGSEDRLTAYLNSTIASNPGASATFAVRRSPEKGRHVIALRPIEVGELLFCEEAVVFASDDLTDYCVACGDFVGAGTQGCDEDEVEETDEVC
jgi:hypothetical protein